MYMLYVYLVWYDVHIEIGMIASYGICLLTLPFATSISFNKCSCVQGVNTPGMCSIQYVR